jgi:hypothetical protein
MKTDRLFVTRVAAVLAVGLLLGAGSPGAGQITFRYHLGRSKAKARVSPTAAFAAALAQAVREVQERFDKGRHTLLPVPGADGKAGYLRQEVVDLIAITGRDLDQAIKNVQPSGTEPLVAWTDDELGHLQGELAVSPGQTAAMPAGFFAPQPVEVIASLGGPSKKKPAKPKPAVPPTPPAPPPDTVPAEKANGVLDEVGKVLSQIFTLASNDNLEVKLWAGSTVSHSTFSFWPEGKIKDSPPPPTIIRMDGNKDHVLRGLYRYRAAWAEGAVTHLIEYPQPAGIQTTPTERLDLVNGTGFFCCRFNEQYCHAVSNEKDCR